LVLAIGNNTYRLDQPKGTTAVTIKSKEVRPKILRRSLLPKQWQPAEGEERDKVMESDG
jgi:hypothetical protein